MDSRRKGGGLLLAVAKGVTDRGEPIAELRPLPPDTSVPAALLKLASRRTVTLPARKAMRAFRPIRSKGRALSEAVREDREERS